MGGRWAIQPRKHDSDTPISFATWAIGFTPSRANATHFPRRNDRLRLDVRQTGVSHSGRRIDPGQGLLRSVEKGIA